MEQLSQVQVIGRPRVRTWDDYEQGCLSTFGGGHRGESLEAFHHGMQTVFNLLRAEFPPAEQCRENAALLRDVRAVLDSVVLRFCEGDDQRVTPEMCDEARALLSRLPETTA